ncbi:hypothetical protein O3G_MSEX006488, partial [Manduca sexta]
GKPSLNQIFERGTSKAGTYKCYKALDETAHNRHCLIGKILSNNLQICKFVSYTGGKV